MSAKTASKAPQEATPADGADEAQAAVAAAGVDWSKLTVELRRGDPRKLRGQDINARFMTAQQMEQFASNLRRDGVLTSLPLCYDDPDAPSPPGEDEILSGHHRRDAAVMAGFAQIDYLCIVSKLTEARKRAIQLSHNAIVGQDDPATLASMYAGLDLDLKGYSGLDDSVLEAMKDVTLSGLNVGVKYQEMLFSFLPEDAEAVAGALSSIDRYARKNQAYVARFADFDDFFETAVRVKTKHQAFNTGVALRLMVDLALERMAQLEADGPGAAAEPEHG